VRIKRFIDFFAICRKIRWNKCRFIVNKQSEVNINVVFEGMQIEFAISDAEKMRAMLFVRFYVLDTQQIVYTVENSHLEYKNIV
jgi:hypothetical protein